MTLTRVKICGITSIVDAQTAFQAGADALGVVFYKQSPRFVTVEQAQEIAAVCGPFVTLTGLFVNPTRGEVEQAINVSGINLLQFHGDEPEDFCQSFNRPYIKAFRMGVNAEPDQLVGQYPSARGYLFDAWSEDHYGGTGKTFDWSRLEGKRDYPLILAGGLTPDNVQQAISALSPYAVDVSSGVETSPGIKNPALVKQFISNAKYRV